MVYKPKPENGSDEPPRKKRNSINLSANRWCGLRLSKPGKDRPESVVRVHFIHFWRLRNFIQSLYPLTLSVLGTLSIDFIQSLYPSEPLYPSTLSCVQATLSIFTLSLYPAQSKLYPSLTLSLYPLNRRLYPFIPLSLYPSTLSFIPLSVYPFIPLSISPFTLSLYPFIQN